MKIARHFSAGNIIDGNHSPGGTTETLMVSAVPPGLKMHTPIVPALKCRAIFGLPLRGADNISTYENHTKRCLKCRAILWLPLRGADNISPYTTHTTLRK